MKLFVLAIGSRNFDYLMWNFLDLNLDHLIRCRNPRIHAYNLMEKFGDFLEEEEKKEEELITQKL